MVAVQPNQQGQLAGGPTIAGGKVFVGTNNVVRIAAVRQVGGLYDSITEDMATSLEMHATRNPATGENEFDLARGSALGAGPALGFAAAAAKLGIDVVLYGLACRRFGRPELLKYLPLWFVLQPVYLTAMAVWGVRPRLSWKR